MEDQAGLAEHPRQVPRQRVGDFAVLGEDQDLLLARGDLLAQLAQPIELAAVRGRIGAVSEPLRGVVADLFEPGEKGQDDAAALNALHLRGLQPFRQIRHRLLIQRRLPPGERAERRHLGLLRQVGDDAFVGLEPPQDVGPHQAPQRGELVLVGLRTALDESGELLGAAQQAGAEKIKERPQIRKPVLDGRAAEGDPVPAAEFLHRAALARARDS